MAEWTEMEEIKSTLEQENSEYSEYYGNPNPAGILIANENGVEYRLCNDWVGTLITGMPRYGKSRGPVSDFIFSCLTCDEIVIVFTTKKNEYRNFRDIASQLGYDAIYHLTVRDPKHSDCFSSLQFDYDDYHSGDPSRIQEANESMFSRAQTVIPSTLDKEEPFWPRSAQNAYLGMSKLLIVNAPDKKYANDMSMNALVSESAFSTRSPVNRTIRELQNDDCHKEYISQIKAYGTLPPDTGNSVKGFMELALTTQKNCTFEYGRLFCDNSTNIRDDLINNRKVFFLITGKDETSLYKEALSAIISDLLNLAIRAAEAQENGYLKRRVNFVIDEFASLSPIADLENILSSAGSRNIRLMLCCQNPAQIKNLYGKERFRIIYSTIQNKIFFTVDDFEDMEQLSELCGYRDIATETDSVMTHSRVPLLPIDAIRKMRRYRCVILAENIQYVWREAYPNTYQRQDYQELLSKSTPYIHEPKSRITEDCIYTWDDFIKQERERNLLSELQKAEASQLPPSPSSETLSRPTDSDSSEEKIDIDKILREIDEELERLDEEEKKSQEQKHTAEHKTKKKNDKKKKRKKKRKEKRDD